MPYHLPKLDHIQLDSYTVVTPNKAKIALFVQKSDDKWAKKRGNFAKMGQKLPYLTPFPKNFWLPYFE